MCSHLDCEISMSKCALISMVKFGCPNVPAFLSLNLQDREIVHACTAQKARGEDRAGEVYIYTCAVRANNIQCVRDLVCNALELPLVALVCQMCLVLL